MDKNLSDLGVAILFDMIPKHKKSKKEIGELDFIIIKVFYSINDTIKKVRIHRMGENSHKSYI